MRRSMTTTTNSKDDLSSRQPRSTMKRSQSIAGFTINSRRTITNSQRGAKPYTTCRDQIRKGGGSMMNGQRHLNTNFQNIVSSEQCENISPEQTQIEADQLHQGEMNKDIIAHLSGLDITDAQKISQMVHPFSVTPQYFTQSQPNIPGSVTSCRPPATMGSSTNYSVQSLLRSPLTPCIPGQIPQFRMKSPETFQTSERPEVPEKGEAEATSGQNLTESQTGVNVLPNTQGAFSEVSQENNTAESMADRSETVPENEVFEQHITGDQADDTLICTPSFGDEFLETNHTTQNTDNEQNHCVAISENSDDEDHDCTITGTDNRPIVNENAFFGLSQIPRRTTIIVIRRANYGSVGEDSEDSDEDERINVNEDADDDGGYADAVNRTLNAHIRRQLFCREISESENTVDDYLGQCAMEDDVSDHVPSTPSTYRDLLRPPSHFRCVICDTNLEVTHRYERSIFGHETGELPSLHVEDGQMESDLHCPECGWRRSGYFSNKILDI